MTRHQRADSPEVYATSNAPNSSAANASFSDHGSKTLAIIALVVSSVLSSMALGIVVTVLVMEPRIADEKLASIQRIHDAQITTLRTDFARVEREYKITQIEVQNQSALLLREGLKLPTDSEHGPGSNLNYQRQEKEHGRNSLHYPAERAAALRRSAPERR